MTDDKKSVRMNYRLKPLPDDETLLMQANRLFEYVDGTLRFRIDPRSPSCLTSKVVGKTVGGDDGHGYLMCMLMGMKFKVHQIVWLLHHREFPKHPIDHINRDRRDNRIENLRSARDLDNMQNLNASTSPSAGTWFCKTSGRYCARLTHNHRKIYLGYFDTVEAANAAYRAKKQEISGQFSPV